MQPRHSPKDALHEHGLKPKKSFGQNFMLDQRINAFMAEVASSWGRNLPIIEIGAGTGALTSHLLKIFPVVHAIERDRDLVPILHKQFHDASREQRLVIHEADGARFELNSLFSSENQGVMVGNLPYHLTSSILILALKNCCVLKGAVFLVQNEVADRLTAAPNSKDYGFLTAILGLAFVLEKVAKVDKSAFWPSPRIDSAIVKLSFRDAGVAQVDDIEKLLVFVRSIFQKRRKKLSTILSSTISKEDISGLGIDPNMRPEQLEPGQFLQLYQFCHPAT